MKIFYSNNEFPPSKNTIIFQGEKAIFFKLDKRFKDENPNFVTLGDALREYSDRRVKLTDSKYVIEDFVLDGIHRSEYFLSYEGPDIELEEETFDSHRFFVYLPELFL